MHIVYSARVDASRAVSAFKASATRRMRETGCWSSSLSPWSAGSSRRQLWTPLQLERAIVYVLDGQGDPLD